MNGGSPTWICECYYGVLLLQWRCKWLEKATMYTMASKYKVGSSTWNASKATNMQIMYCMFWTFV
jgi:hypothetical protein